MTGLVRRGAVYWLRVRVPTDISNTMGKRERCFSLKTSDLHIAKQRLSIERLKLEAEFEKARREKSRAAGSALPTTSEVSFLDPEEIQRIVLGWFYDLEKRNLSSDTGLLRTATPLELRDAVVDLRQDESSLAEEAGPAASPDAPNWSNGEVEALLANHGISLPPAHPQYDFLKRLIIRGLMEAARRRSARLSGQLTPVSDDAFFSEVFGDQPLPSRVVMPSKKPLTVKVLVERFISEQAPKKLRPKTLDLYRQIARDFASVVGTDRAIPTLGRDDFVNFRDLLTCVPANATKRFPNLSLQQVANFAQENGIEPMAAKTVNKKLEFLSTLFKYAYNSDHVSKNHASGLSVPEKSEKKDRSISTPQLTALFSAPVFTGCVNDEDDYAKPGNAHPRRGKFWVPLIALFSGMRLNEICQLYVEDIKTSDGITFFDIRETLDTGGVGTEKRLKTGNARRQLPIHPELQRIGFLRFVGDARDAAQQRLFPELTLGATGNYSDKFQKWFKRFREQIKGTEVSPYTFHWLRHTFRDALREAAVSTEIANRICGWKESKGMASHYGRGPSLMILNAEISKVAFRGLDLSHLHFPANGQDVHPSGGPAGPF